MEPTLEFDGVRVHPCADAAQAGRLAGDAAYAAIHRAVQARGEARVIFASAPSQETMLARLVDLDCPWEHVVAFHMDEYVGLPSSDPRSFSGWLADRLPIERFAAFHPIDGTADDPEAELARYGALVSAAPIDVACMGFGVNGHIAFNEPGDTQFEDPRPIREVVLDIVSRRQQVDEDCFDSLEEVPTAALTLTVPTLVQAGTVIVTVLGSAKARAVRRALTGEIGSDCPGSAIRGHKDAAVYLDRGASRLLGALPATPGPPARHLRVAGAAPVPMPDQAALRGPEG